MLNVLMQQQLAQFPSGPDKHTQAVTTFRPQTMTDPLGFTLLRCLLLTTLDVSSRPRLHSPKPTVKPRSPLTKES